MKHVEQGEKADALDGLASLLADCRDLHYLVMAKEDDKQDRENDQPREKATTPASRADLLALQKQVEQLCITTQDATPPKPNERNLRGEVASLKEAVTNLIRTIKNDREPQRIAMERM